MHRFYVPPELCRSELITLPETEAHHAARVLRLQPGEPVVVLDGIGTVRYGRTREVTKRTVTVSVERTESAPALPGQLTLLQAIPKAKAMDYIVQKATELGVARIIPILSERAVVQLSAADAAAKAEKLLPVAIEAIKQCGSPWLPRIEPALRLPQFLARAEQFDLSLVASLQPGSRSPREFIQAFQAQHHRLPRAVAVWIGPEGDFTPEEISQLIHHGASPITLGPLVLRSDTAAIYSLSVLNYELQAHCADGTFTLGA